MNTLKNLFSEDIQQILSDETILALESAITERENLAVEAALKTQDEEYAEELEKLVRIIDQDHSKKMRRVFESYDKDKSAKLLKVVKHYERQQNADLRKFKRQVVKTIGSYIDTFITESVPVEDIRQAVNNKTAYHVLENLRNVLSIDSAVINKSISGAIVEGKQRLDEMEEENNKLRAKLKTIEEKHEAAARALFLEEHVAKLPQVKRDFVKKTLKDKPLSYVKENYEYVVKLFDKNEKSRLKDLQESALKERQHKPDFVQPEKIISEKVNTPEVTDMYLDELDKSGRF